MGRFSKVFKDALPCCVQGCSNPRYFLFPSDALARKIWLERIGDPGPGHRQPKICKAHFHKSCFIERKKIKKLKKEDGEEEKVEDVLELVAGSLPTLHLPKFKVASEEEAFRCSNHRNLKLSKGEEALIRINAIAPVSRTSLIEPKCSVSGCNNTEEETVMHQLPMDNEIYPIWIERMGNPKLQVWHAWKDLWRYRVCNRHFSIHCHISEYELDPNSVPSLYMPLIHDDSPRASLIVLEPNRKIRMRKKRCSAPDCNANSVANPDVNFFRFPKHYYPSQNSKTNKYRDRCELWRKVLWLKESDPANFLCDRHFAKSDIIDGKLRPGANPCYPTGYLNPLTNNYSPIMECELRSDEQIAKERPYHEKTIGSTSQEDEVAIPTSSAEETFIVEEITTLEPGHQEIPPSIVFQLAIQYVDKYNLASAEQTKFLRRCQNFAERYNDPMEFIWKKD